MKWTTITNRTQLPGQFYLIRICFKKSSPAPGKILVNKKLFQKFVPRSRYMVILNNLVLKNRT